MLSVCIDIGAGTQDILIFDSAERLENSIKLVLPAPARRLAGEIRGLNKDLFVSGRIIGGGSVTKGMLDHMKKGFRVFISAEAAKTVRDNPDEVRELGFNVVEAVENADICFDEFDFDIISGLIERYYSGNEIGLVAIAVQDHGYKAGQPDRVTRFEFLKSFLSNGLHKACFKTSGDIPEYFSRWRSIAESIASKTDTEMIITDTGVAAALGASYEINKYPLLAVDVGNCHTFAALIGENDRVIGFFEHHTDSLTPDKMSEFVERLATGSLTFEDIYNDSGHGAHIYEKITASGCPVLVTGPRRMELFPVCDKNTIFATPAGDTMMTGPVGMLRQAGKV